MSGASRPSSAQRSGWGSWPLGAGASSHARGGAGRRPSDPNLQAPYKMKRGGSLRPFPGFQADNSRGNSTAMAPATIFENRGRSQSVDNALRARTVRIVDGGQLPEPRNSTRNEGHVFATDLTSKCRQYPYEHIKKFTDNFAERRRIGHGGEGTVYRARLPDSSDVAVKVIDNLGNGTGAGERFEEEINTLSKFRHCNLVTLMGWARKDEKGYLMYEFLPGGDVQEKLNKAKLGKEGFPWSDRISVASQAAAGLSHMVNSPEKAFHRDIKLSNLLLDANGRAKMADFGLTRRLRKSGDSRLHVGQASGTPGYMCPEFARTRIVSEQSEVYSFGVLLLQLIVALPASVRGVNGMTSYPLIETLRPAEQDVIGRVHKHADASAKWPHDVLAYVGRLALQCIDNDALKRPRFQDIVAELHRYDKAYEPITEIEEQNGATGKDPLDKIVAIRAHVQQLEIDFEMTVQKMGEHGITVEEAMAMKDKASRIKDELIKIDPNSGPHLGRIQVDHIKQKTMKDLELFLQKMSKFFVQIPEEAMAMDTIQRAQAELDALDAQAEDIAAKLVRDAVTPGQAKMQLARTEVAARKVKGDVCSISSQLSFGKNKAAEQIELSRQKKQLISRLELLFTRLEVSFKLTQEAEEAIDKAAERERQRAAADEDAGQQRWASKPAVSPPPTAQQPDMACFSHKPLDLVCVATSYGELLEPRWPRGKRSIALPPNGKLSVGRQHQRRFFEDILDVNDAGKKYSSYISRTHFELIPLQGEPGYELTNLGQSPLKIAGTEVLKDQQAVLKKSTIIDFICNEDGTPTEFLTMRVEPSEEEKA